MIIRGNTVATNMLRSDFSENDPGKASFILNKPDVAKAQSTADKAVKDAENAQKTADASLPKAGGDVTGAVNFQAEVAFHQSVCVPTPSDASNPVTKEYCDTVQEELTLAESGWSELAPYTQTMELPSLTQGKKARAFPRWPTQPDTELKEEMAKLSAAGFETGSVTFSCWEDRPKRDLPIIVEVYV